MANVPMKGNATQAKKTLKAPKALQKVKPLMKVC